MPRGSSKPTVTHSGRVSSRAVHKLGQRIVLSIPLLVQTPKRPKTVEHEEQKLRLGEGYEAAPDAKSVQKDAIDVDNKRIKLGVKYHTQGRNE